MGRDSITPFTEIPEKGAFILCRTSNPSAIDLQSLSTGKELLFDKNQDISSPLGNYNLRGNLVIFPSFLCYSFNKIKSGFLQVLAFDIIGPKLK